jgi:hypothetical protein
MAIDPTILYQQGQSCIGRGAYREAIALLEQAQTGTARATRLNGDIRFSLVMAYEAAGERDQARGLCRELQTHPDSEIRRQATHLLYILEAPQLERKAEWVVQIPDLDHVSESRLRPRGSGHAKPKADKTDYRLTPPDNLASMNTRDNQFLWFGLFIVVILGAGLWLVN